MLELLTFWMLVLIGLTRKAQRTGYLRKSSAAWVLDVSGLMVQGALIPFLQMALVVVVLKRTLPDAEGILAFSAAPWVMGFLLNFVAVDYLYYWNHRLFHHARWWPIHRVHHSVTEMDVLGTSRNTLWSSFLIVYLWLNGLMVFLLREPAGYLAGAAITASLDLWRHSNLGPRSGGIWERWLGGLLVLPQDHAAHHADTEYFGNYGANLCVWDKMHGTFLRRGKATRRLGIPTRLSVAKQLLWPFP